MAHPDLSVVIPAYNAGSTIAAAVKSALRVASDVIVVDDESSDSTAAIAENLGATVIRQRNGGAYAARRAGGHRVETSFLVFLDSDDELVAGGVFRSVEMLENDSGLGVVAGRVIGRKRSGNKSTLPRGYFVVNPESLTAYGYSPWPPAAQVIRTSAYAEQLEMKLPALAPRYAEDYELLFRLSIVSKVDCHAEPSCIYRLSGGKSALNALGSIECAERIRNYYGAYCSLDWDPLTRRQRMAAAKARTAHAALSDRDFAGAISSAASVLLLNPSVATKAVRRRITRQ